MPQATRVTHPEGFCNGVPGTPELRTAYHVERAAVLAFRGQLLRRQRKLEDRFLIEGTRTVALALAQVRGELTTLELEAVGLDFDA